MSRGARDSQPLLAFAAAALVLLLAGAARAAEPLHARSAEGEATTRRGSAEQEPFRWQVVACGNRLRSEWHDRRAALVAWDEVRTGELGMESYRLVRPALGQDWRVERDGRWIRVASPGRFEQIRVDDGQIVLAGAQLVEFIERRLPALRAGERFEVAYLLPEHARVLELRIFSRPDPGRAGIEVRVEPAAALLRALVPPTLVRFHADGQFQSLEGTLLPQAGSAEAPRALVGVARSVAPTTTVLRAATLARPAPSGCVAALALRQPG